MTAIAPSTHPDLGLDDLPQHCRFQHPFFSKLGEIVFHPGEGEGLPVLEMALDDKIATLPLHSLQIELEIEEAFADGRMLALIARALEFVNDLRLGEALPAEELGGGASWQPDQVDLKLAVSRIKLLAAWPGDGKKDEWRDVNDEMILAMVDSPDTRQRVQEALAAVAQALGLANTEAGVDLVEDAARELAFVEALRARLLHRVEAASVRLEHLARGIRGDATRHEVMTRVRRLMGIAVVRFRTWFEELDAQTGEVLALLRNFTASATLSAPTETGFTAVCARGSAAHALGSCGSRHGREALAAGRQHLRLPSTPIYAGAGVAIHDASLLQACAKIEAIGMVSRSRIVVLADFARHGTACPLSRPRMHSRSPNGPICIPQHSKES